MSGRVYVGHLSSRATERDVEHFFRGFGRIREVVLKNGFGFVEFDDSRDADDAVHDLNGRDLCGEPRGGGGGGGGGFDRYGGGGGGGRGRGDGGANSRFGPPVQTRHRLLITNLSTRCSWQDLKDLMRNAGEVTFADAHKRVPNEGIVCFASSSDLRRALDKYQGKNINGRRIKLTDDSDGGGGRRSRSRSPRRASRSRSRSPRSRSRSPRASRSPSSRSRSRSASHNRSRSRSPPSEKNSPKSD